MPRRTFWQAARLTTQKLNYSESPPIRAARRTSRNESELP